MKNDIPEKTDSKNNAKRNIVKSILTIFSAVMVLVVLIAVVPNNSVSAYYTVDINPSFCLLVDEDDIVTGIEYVNDDAKELKESIDCVGLPIDEAIEVIIAVAKEAGYVTDGQYILVGKFAAESEEKDFTDLQTKLEQSFGDMIQLVVVNGTLEDKEAADELSVSAGLLKLSELAGKTSVTQEEKVEDFIEEPRVEPTVSGETADTYIRLNWTEETSKDLSGYKIVASKTNPNPSYPDDGYLKYITDASTTTIKLYAGDGGLEAGMVYYFSVTYLYKDGTSTVANAVKLQVPAKTKETQDDDKDPEDTPTSDYVSTTISGSISGDYAKLSWDKITHEALDGYKVMYSFSDTTPVYGEDKCYYAKWITDPSTTECTLNVTELKGYQPNVKCYFSITALYNDHKIKKAGNTIKLLMPDTETQPYVSTDISGARNKYTISLTWDKIEHKSLDGYKVMYSFSDTTPVYRESGCYYYKWITDPSTTSCTISNIKELNGYLDGATCYFSITALYNDHSVKKPGNTISIIMPTAQIAPELSITSQTGNQIDLAWNMIDHGEFEGFTLLYACDGGSGTISELTSATSANGIDLSTLNGYAENKEYTFKLNAVYSNGESKTDTVTVTAE